MPFDLLRLGCHVPARNARHSGRRREQAEQDLYGGRLPRAVRAEETEDFTFFDLEAHVIHGDKTAEDLGEVLGKNSCFPFIIGQALSLEQWTVPEVSVRGKRHPWREQCFSGR